MALLTKSALLSRQVLKTQKVEFENGDYVFVREMTGADRDNFERSIMKERKNEKGEVKGFDQILENFRAKLAVVTLCDENGELLLEPKDVKTLSSSISISRLEQIVTAASELNKISEKDKADLLKNSEAIPVDNSNSDSVEN